MTSSSTADEVDSSSQMNIKLERIYDESIDHTQHNIMYDLLPKPIDVKKGMKLSITTGFDFKQGQFLFDIISTSSSHYTLPVNFCIFLDSSYRFT